MISVRLARARVLGATRPLPAERVPLAAGNGRVLTVAPVAPFALPRFTNAAMDGYALRSAETKSASAARAAGFRIRREVLYAGSNTVSAIPAGTAVRIMTGAPLPRGSDAVVLQEEARIDHGALLVRKPVRARRNVRVAGEDWRAGEKLVPAGTRIDPGVVALLSAFGITEVEVRRRPRVAIVVTGNEVLRPSNRRPRGHVVYDSHSGFLTAALGEFPLSPALVSYSRDNVPQLKARFTRALGCADLVLVTGGVSVGERDLVCEVLSSVGVKTVFRGVSQKPGKPLYFGRRGGVLVFGLPGNPVSTVVCYCEYVRPCLRRMQGLKESGPEEWVASLSRPVRGSRGRTVFLRGRLASRSGRWSVSPASAEGSHRFRAFRNSDCLIVVPPNARASFPRGSRVKVHPFPWRKP